MSVLPLSECAFSLQVANVMQKTTLVIPRESQTAFLKGHVKTCHEVSKDDGFTLLKSVLIIQYISEFCFWSNNILIMIP